jgi:hypothetical protein
MSLDPREVLDTAATREAHSLGMTNGISQDSSAVTLR